MEKTKAVVLLMEILIQQISCEFGSDFSLRLESALNGGEISAYLSSDQLTVFIHLNHTRA